MLRRLLLVGFAVLILPGTISQLIFGVTIALAFLIAQLIDVWLFDSLRKSGGWWTAPLVSSTVASAIDTILFFSIAFTGSGLPWVTWGVGDFGAKMCVALAMLIPFRMLMQFTRPQGA